jgi:hypothetical protein
VTVHVTLPDGTAILIPPKQAAWPVTTCTDSGAPSELYESPVVGYPGADDVSSP